MHAIPIIGTKCEKDNVHYYVSRYIHSFTPRNIVLLHIALDGFFFFLFFTIKQINSGLQNDACIYLEFLSFFLLAPEKEEKKKEIILSLLLSLLSHHFPLHVLMTIKDSMSTNLSNAKDDSENANPKSNSKNTSGDTPVKASKAT